jgi:hypothetical protein
VARDGVEDHLPVLPPQHKGVLEQLEHLVGSRGVLAARGHLLDADDAVGDPPFALGQVPIRQGEVFKFLLEVAHRDARRSVQAGAHVSLSRQRLRFGMPAMLNDTSFQITRPRLRPRERSSPSFAEGLLWKTVLGLLATTSLFSVALDLLRFLIIQSG